MLDDLELQWKKGRLHHLQAAMELLIWVVLGEHLDKVTHSYRILVKCSDLSSLPVSFMAF